MAFPEPPKPITPPTDIGSFKGEANLTANEATLILDSTLIPEHRNDPNILRFISSYMACRDVRQAAREAGIDARSGRNLRSRPDIHLVIQKLTDKAVMKYGFDATEIIEKVKEIVNIDPIEFENADGSFKTHMSEIDPEARRAIKKFKAKNIYGLDPNGMKTVVGELIEVELWDKMRGAELLGREKDIFTEKKKVEHDVTSNMAQVLLESSKRGQERKHELIDVTPLREDIDDTSNGDS